jgi:hypothetical protein
MDHFARKRKNWWSRVSDSPARANANLRLLSELYLKVHREFPFRLVHRVTRFPSFEMLSKDGSYLAQEELHAGENSPLSEFSPAY